MNRDVYWRSRIILIVNEPSYIWRQHVELLLVNGTRHIAIGALVSYSSDIPIVYVIEVRLPHGIFKKTVKPIATYSAI